MRPQESMPTLKRLEKDCHARVDTARTRVEELAGKEVDPLEALEAIQNALERAQHDATPQGVGFAAGMAYQIASYALVARDARREFAKAVSDLKRVQDAIAGFDELDAGDPSGRPGGGRNTIAP